jgi:hypothetical protein
MRRAKLFHTLVAMGVTLTGGTLGVTGCSGGGDETPSPAECTGSDCHYANISPYQGIAHDGGPRDGSTDSGYATIAYDAAGYDAYGNISPAPPPDSGPDA